ncbi:protein kinase, partial [candidate division KSB1 bacterium]|nr:protein kinase [candidate division KSB1 bacterium]NIR68530.1 protein kinase [candidate division KSB1 bacterium]NIS22757.1 protein kinase [candidate division KSB1 bacterium]NIT69388.1 protein kinase [candidate division KSB1 bacterium]NIU23265.1 protein kinase [candidate division KSB1 bacterium]
YYYIASEHINTENWLTLNEDNVEFSHSELLQVLAKIAIALRHAHLKGVTHGSLHPAAIYVTPDLKVKIDDFGFHVLIPELMSEKAEIEEDFKFYVPPEIVRQTTEIDGRADIYSLGMILFHILSGQLPFFEPELLSSKEHRSLISAAENLFAHSLRKNPERRFLNLKDFITELKNISCELFGTTDVIEVVEEEFKSIPTNCNPQAFV